MSSSLESEMKRLQKEPGKFWEESLEEIKKVRAVKLQAVRVKFEYMRMSDDESLDDYLARFFGIVNNLKSLGEEITENRIVQKIWWV